MKVAIFIAPSDFKDETVSSARSLLEKWGVEGVITSMTMKECKGYHGAVYKPQINSAYVNPDDFSAILLVDGIGVESYKLYETKQLIDTVKMFYSSGKIVAAVGNAMKILAKASVVLNTKVAAPADPETKRIVMLYKGIPSENEVEVQKNVITAGKSDKTSELVGLMLDSLGLK